MNNKWIKVIGTAATVFGLLANVVTEWVNERKMTEMINEKVDKALAEREDEEEKEES